MTDDSMQEISRALGRIEGKMDGVLEEQRELGTRVRAVESKVDRILAWAAGAGAVGGGAIAFLKSKLFGHT